MVINLYKPLNTNPSLGLLTDQGVSFYIYLYSMIYYGSCPQLVMGYDIYRPNNSTTGVVKTAA